MLSPYTHRDRCRLCDSPRLDVALPLPRSPIADAFVPAAELDVVQPAYPMDLYLCRDCGHAQLCDVINPDLLFRGYLFETQSSLGLVDHFRQYAAQLLAAFPISANELVVEIGSNDGSLLACFHKAGLRALGVDPATRLAAAATAAGIPTLPEFFTSELARTIRREHGPARFVAANNVFAHADHLADMAAGVRELLAPHGVFVFEVSYLLDIVEKLLFDTIYHEHLSYHAVRPLIGFLERAGLQLFDVERLATKGGSIRCFAQRQDGGAAVSPHVAELLEQEAAAGLDRLEVYATMSRRIEEARAGVQRLMAPYLDAGQIVAGYGASPTTTTLMYAFHLEEQLSFLVDDNPRKHGLYSPGRHLPVLPSAALYERKPALVVVLAWAYLEPILRRHAAYLEAGGRFLVPLPKARLS